MRKVLSVLLSVIILLSATKNSFFVVLRSYDPILFTEVFCQNRDKPKMCCKGRCALKKEMQQYDNRTSKDEKENGVLSVFKDSVVFAVYGRDYMDSFFVYKKKKQEIFSKDKMKIRDMIVFIFVPPQGVV